MEASGYLPRKQERFEFAKPLLRISVSMTGNVLDLEVEIVMMSVVLGSTSISCPFLTLIVQLKPHILT
jgi:hypothetical protein